MRYAQFVRPEAREVGHADIGNSWGVAGRNFGRAGRGAQGFAGRVVLIGEELHRPNDRPPLSKDFLAGKITVQDLWLESPDDTQGTDPLHAEWLLGAAARSLDAATRTHSLTDGTQIEADGIVIATGASARTLPVLAGLANVHTLRTQDLAQQLIPGTRLVIVGAGFIGAEVASTAQALGAAVTVLCSDTIPLSRPSDWRWRPTSRRYMKLTGWS